MNNTSKNKTIRFFVGHLLGLIFILGVVIAAAIILFNQSFGWFSSNRDVDGNSMQVSIKASDYEILMHDNGSNGLFYTNYHSKVLDNNNPAVIWQMTDTYNMNNHQYEGLVYDTIYPGSSGVLSFYVQSNIESVTLDFTFEIIGYTASGTEPNITMSAIDSDEAPGIFLNGHILLFENRVLNEDPNKGASDDTYIYSGPILTNDDMQRVLSNKTYQNSANPTQVDIYWVWPHTLSDLIDARACEKIDVDKIPFTRNDDYSAIVENIRTYPDYYCKGISRPAKADKPTEKEIATDYDIYGDYYDLGDNDIGMEIDYILVKMTVNKHVSSGD